MLDLLRLAVFLSIPILIFGSLLWVLIYTAIRMAIRHEFARAQRRGTRSRPAPADGQSTRLRPAANTPLGSRDGAEGRTAATPARSRAAS